MMQPQTPIPRLRKPAGMPRWIYWILLILLGACSQANLLQKIATPQIQAQARNYIDLLRHRQFGEIEKVIDSSISGPTLHPTLARMAALIPEQEPTSVRLVGAQRFDSSGTTTVNLTYEYDFSGKWMLINVEQKMVGGATTIVGFHVTTESESLEARNRFTLTGKDVAQYLLLTMMIVMPLLTLYALVVCIRAKMARRKWLWILFILFGFGKIAVNWTTGQWSFAPLTVQLLSASAVAPLYGPWTLAVSLPIGAIYFLFFRRRSFGATA